MSTPDLAVIIVSYNTRDLLRDCLHALQTCSLPLRIIVVDNASHDGSPALVQHLFPPVELLALSENLGFAAATNLGISHCMPLPAYLLLLNPDTRVHPGAIEAMVAFLEAHPRVGLVGPRLLNPDGSRQSAAFRFPTLLMTALDLFPPGEVLPGRLYDSWWHGRYPHEGGDQPFAIDHPLGACMLVRRAVVEQVGMLDQRYFMYSEEVAWCWRIKQAGWAIWQEPAALVTHVGGAATSQVRTRMLVALWQSRARFVREQGPAWRIRAHQILVILGMLRLILITWWAYVRQRGSRTELRARLTAYGWILRAASVALPSE